MEMEELLAKYFTGEASADERSFAETWRARSEDNAKFFFDLKMIWLESLQNQESGATFFEEEVSKKGLQAWLIESQLPKYIAAAMLIFALGLIFILNNRNDSLEPSLLVDGSSVKVHKGSSVEVLKMDGKTREVRIDGKAYFDIEEDKTRPFIIHTSNAKVVVLGTSFLVDTDETQTIVCVESGIVELVKEVDVSVKLEQGDMGIASTNNRGLIKTPNENSNYLAWKTRLIRFNGESMGEVASILEDVYDVKVEFDNTTFKDCKLTAQIQKKSLKEALEIISRTFEVEYELKNQVATFRGKGC